MRSLLRRVALVALMAGCAHVASAQTADEVVDRCVTALGGRAALGKLKSRSTVGTITLSTPAGAISGSVEVLNAAPNKSRTLIKADLSSFGGGQLVFDQRFDGTSGYVLDSIQGNRDMTGSQLEYMRNESFPSALLNYKAMGTTANLSGQEKVGERDAYVLIFEPPSGPVVRQYIDAGTYLPIRMVLKVDVPQIGQEVEQTIEFFDYREVDGVKLAFQLRAASTVTSFTINVTKVEHNITIDEALFSKPAAP
jgi:hypothetical protein